jgi:ubiquinone/menaquinone biosynthesis C-methylase UbiE
MKMYKNKELYNLMKQYYKNYYLGDLKLNDWESRFENNRIEEEEKLGSKVAMYFNDNNINLNNKKILVVGGGTGAEVFYLYQNYTDVDVHTIEPFDDAINILNKKTELLNFPKNNIKKSFSEDLPFEDNYFDIVICFTVLEHVSSVENSILEMYRVVKGKGWIMIETPNYLFPEEQHYKVTIFPPRMSKTLARLNLKMYGRYTDFFESLNFFSDSDLDTLLVKNNIEYIRKEQNYLKYAGWKSFIRYFPRYVFSWIFGVTRNQLIFISKN